MAMSYQGFLVRTDTIFPVCMLMLKMFKFFYKTRAQLTNKPFLYKNIAECDLLIAMTSWRPAIDLHALPSTIRVRS